MRAAAALRGRAARGERPLSDPELRVPLGQRLFGALFARWPGFGRALGDLESRVLAETIAATAIDRPVYVAGLARSGSTMLLEALARHPAFTSHRYSDYPPVWTPYWWNHLRARLPLPPAPARERAHRDGIAVTPDSPEAFEEPLWMHFFAQAHDPARDQVLDAATSNPAFEAFYAAHVRKLLAVRGARRYVAKGNYNIARFGYLQRLFPDARFVVPWREPVAHVASLVKQDRLFREAARARPEVARQLARNGHFEFGPQARAERLGTDSRADEIGACRAAGKVAAAYALQWADTYGWLLDHLDANPALREACRFVGYDALCARPAEVLTQVFAHAEALDADGERLVGYFATRLRAPDYYRPDFDDRTRAEVKALTAPVHERLMRLDGG